MSEEKQESAETASEGLNDHHAGVNGRGSEMPNCCGPLMARVKREFGKQPDMAGEGDSPSDDSSVPSCCDSMMSGAGEGDQQTGSCPMSAMFGRASRKSGFGFLMMIPGLLFVLAGVAIIFEPQVLVWLMAGVSIFIGIAMFAIANFFRKLAVS